MNQINKYFCDFLSDSYHADVCVLAAFTTYAFVDCLQFVRYPTYPNSVRAEINSTFDYSDITLPSRLESTTLDTNHSNPPILGNNHYITNSLESETETAIINYLAPPIIRIRPTSLFQDLFIHFNLQFPNGRFPVATNLLPREFSCRKKLEHFYYDAPSGNEVGCISWVRNLQCTLDQNHILGEKCTNTFKLRYYQSGSENQQD